VRDPEIDACLTQIAGARECLGLILSEVREGRVLNPMDWRGWVRKRPVEWTLGAAAAGFLLAGPGRTSREGGGATVLDDLARAGLETALHLLLKTVP
jgi:hypothetical protein